VLGYSRAHSGSAYSADVQRLNRHLEAFAANAQQSFLGQLYVVESQFTGSRAANAKLFLKLAYRQTLGFLRHNKSGNAGCPLVRVRHGKDDVVIGHAGVGDPCLVAIEHPAVFRFNGKRLDAGRVGARIRFRQAEGEYLALDCERQILLALFLGAVFKDKVRGEPMSAYKCRDAGASLCKLLLDDGRVYDAAATAAILLGDIGTHKPGRLDFSAKLPVEAVLVHPFVAGCNFVLSEFASHVAEHFLFLCQLN
jgi:hypothetical protein